MLLAVSGAPAAAPDSPQPPVVKSQAIWDVAAQKVISRKILFDRLKDARQILIGQRAENRQHQQIAARLIRQLDKSGRQPTVLLGQVERHRQNAFALFAQRHPDPAKTHDATGLDMLLDWSNSGQPPWAAARPVFDVIMLRKLPVQAVGLSRYEVGEIYRRGPGGLPDDLKKRLPPLLPALAPITARLSREITATYCHSLPPEVVAKFIRVRQAQDSLFALAIADQQNRTDGAAVVLITTPFHIDRKSGAPRYLRQMKLAGKTVSLLIREQDAAEAPPQAVDYIWYTDSRGRPDPCGFIANGRDH